jgi:hypothetical protein
VSRNTVFKIGAATVAAAAGAILAITSVTAQPSTQVSPNQVSTVHANGKSAIGSLIADFEQKEAAAKAAKLLAAQKKKAAALAALAAKKKAEAAELAAQQQCEITDQAEDAAEKAADAAERAADAAEDAAETPGTNDAAEDAAERAADKVEDAAERAADKVEDAAETPCGNDVEHRAKLARHDWKHGFETFRVLFSFREHGDR